MWEKNFEFKKTLWVSKIYIKNVISEKIFEFEKNKKFYMGEYFCIWTKFVTQQKYY